MAARPTLLDLYKRWAEHTVTGLIDNKPVEIKVWLKKLSPTEHAKATRAASAARARHLAVALDPESDAYLAVKDDVFRMGDRDALIDYLTVEDVDKMRSSAEAALAAEPEWSEEGYLDGLRDSWVEGLADRYAEDPEDPEAKRVMTELTRFTDAVAERVEPGIEDLRASYDHVPMDELHNSTVDQVIKNRAVLVWVNEFYRQQMFFGTRRHDDRNQRYFANFDELDEMETQVRVQLQQGFEALTVDATEGKGSEEIPPSSDSSESPAAAETGASSGPKAAVR